MNRAMMKRRGKCKGPCWKIGAAAACVKVSRKFYCFKSTKFSLKFFFFFVSKKKRLTLCFHYRHEAPGFDQYISEQAELATKTKIECPNPDYHLEAPGLD